MAEFSVESKAQPEETGAGVCPMCRERLKPGANACVWCGYLLHEHMQRVHATQRRAKILGRSRVRSEPITSGDWVCCLMLGLIAPVGLVAGQGGAVTVLSALLLLIAAGMGFIALVTAQLQRLLAYLLAGAIGTGLFIILLVAYQCV